MFREGGQRPPADLPDVVRIWRGTSGVDADVAARGESWTLNRDVAAWFAMRRSGGSCSPLLLVTDVPRTSLLHYDDQRHEAEVVCMNVMRPAIDGTPEAWQSRFEIHERHILKEKRVMVSTRDSGPDGTQVFRAL
jgi:hypothetical protein